MTQEIALGARFGEVVDITRRLEQVHSQKSEEREAKRPRGSGGFSGASSRGQSHHNRGHPYRPAQMANLVHCGASQTMVHTVLVQRYCPHLLGGLVQQRGQAMTSTPVTSPPAQPTQGGAQAARGHLRLGGRSGGSQARCYAFPSRSEAVASDTVITCIVSVCHNDASILFVPGSTYSYVSLYFARYLDMQRESLVSSVHESMLVGDSIIVDRVYQVCVVTIGGLEMRVYILIVSMVNLDVILGWIGYSHVMLFWIVMLRLKGCLSYLDFVGDVGADTPTIDSVLVVRDFLDVFPVDLLGMPPNRDIDFGMDLVTGTQPISIPLYHVAPAELKELKEQLEELLDKGFIRPSVSPWGAPILFVKKKDGTMRIQEEHAQHLRIVLRMLREEKLYAKFCKCGFRLSSVEVLGTWCPARGSRYYHRVVKGFSSIVAPLTKLTQKGAPFRWSDECEESFQSSRLP
ncbi:uncharacterized protein [Nicotiana tomentosiformis]|uniref:uncharacterized protein n=1 Tax=Nicotiana tomentosiformis TaxID=4098 RepID=UPI00388CB057